MGEKLTSACDLYRWQCGVIETTHPPVVVNDACQYYSWCCLRVLPRSSACEHNFSAPNQRSSHISHIKTSIQLAGRYVAYFFLIWGNPHIWSHIFDPSWKNFQLYSQKVDFFFNFSGLCSNFVTGARIAFYYVPRPLNKYTEAEPSLIFLVGRGTILKITAILAPVTKVTFFQKRWIITKVSIKEAAFFLSSSING